MGEVTKKKHAHASHIFSIFFLFTSSICVVLAFAIEFGAELGNIAYGFAPPFLIVYLLYLLGAVIAINALQGKITRSSHTFIESVFLLYLIGALGIWVLSSSIVFAISLFVIGLSLAIGFTTKHFYLIYPLVLLFDTFFVILKHHQLVCILCLGFLGLYFLFLLKLKLKVKNHDEKL